MAATFVVEDGTGLSTANAYISYADANTYWENYGNPSTWTDEDQATREEAIRIATQYLDAVYKLQWRGTRSDQDQALDWPRTGGYDPDGYAIDSDAVPTAVEQACCELAHLHITEDDGLIPDLDDPGTVSAYAVKVGPVSESTKWAGGKGEFKEFALAERVLASVIESGTMLYRG